MLVAGFIAVCAILLSPTFSGAKEKKSTEKETVLIQAPADAVPGNTIKMDEPAIPLLTQIEEPKKETFLPAISTREVTKYFKVLLRTLIAPNAP